MPSTKKLLKDFEAIGFTLTPEDGGLVSLSHIKIEWELPLVAMESLPTLLEQLQALHKNNLFKWFNTKLGFYLSFDWQDRVCLLDETQTENTAYHVDPQTGRVSENSYSAGGPESHGVYPGTPMYEEVAKWGSEKIWANVYMTKTYGSFQVHFTRPTTPQEIEKQTLGDDDFSIIPVTPVAVVTATCKRLQEQDYESGAIDKLIKYSKAEKFRDRTWRISH